MTEIEGLIFNSAYEIASKITGIKPTGMGEDERFDRIFSKVEKAITKIMEEE